MLDELTQRLREMDEVPNARRQGMWQYGSVGSVPSSNGSISYQSPAGSTSHIAAAYHQNQQSPPPLQQTPSQNDHPQLVRQISPQQFPQQRNMYQPTAQYPVQQMNPYVQAQPQHQAQTPRNYPQHQQQFSFNEPMYRKAGFPTAPNQQFAAWAGYGGPTVQNTLDEENAVPPKSNLWEFHNT